MFPTYFFSQAARALSPEEQEEYDQFHKHQAKGTGNYKLCLSFSSAYFVVCTLFLFARWVQQLSACR